MKRRRFSEEQIIGVLKEHQAGLSAADLCRKHGISFWAYLCDRVAGRVTGAARHDEDRNEGRVRVDRLEATVEAHMMCAARVREACGIPGVSVQTTFLCRDKPAMKEALREAGIPCAQSTGTDDADEVRAFAKEVGYMHICLRGSKRATGMVVNRHLTGRGPRKQYGNLALSTPADHFDFCVKFGAWLSRQYCEQLRPPVFCDFTG